MLTECLEQKPGYAAHQWQKGIANILNICQLYSFFMGEQHVLNRFVLQALNLFLTMQGF